MNNGINLLVDKRNAKLFTQEKDRLRIFRFGAIGILFLVGASSIILSILIVFSPLDQLRKEEQQTRDQLVTFKLDMNKLAFVNERGDNIRKVLEERTSYDKKLEIVESKMTQDIKIDELTINKKNYTIKFSSKNLDSLDQLLNGLTSITGKGHDFSRIYLTSLSIVEEKKLFTLVIDLLSI